MVSQKEINNELLENAKWSFQIRLDDIPLTKDQRDSLLNDFDKVFNLALEINENIKN